MTLFQDDETYNGWPLGLDIMNTRLRVMEGEGTQAALAEVEPDSTHMRTISFTSLSSSNLDTESTKSFFQDNSVSLGRLIGFKGGNGGSLYFPKAAIRFEEHERITTTTVGGRCSDVLNKGQNNVVDLSHGICIPLLMKMSRSRSKQRV
ncbi:hypothetical protein Ddye_024139 [Dipteronia dyeriana]|uniref:Uncharacterized protein n=1 Tax=Dipteronia dyeriana TaxID=168575 RepID=A0AAD9WTA8_9ROSI|nr:hypothetical protein Ddye_024139 [Dipteronia dyeriana]